MQMDERLEALRSELTVERKRQIEVVVDRLGREHVLQEQEWEIKLTDATERIRKESEVAKAQLTNKLQDARVQIDSLEKERVLMEQSVQSGRCAAEASAARLEDVQKQLAVLESEKTSWQANADKTLDKHKDELWRVAEIHDREMEQIRGELDERKKELGEERRRSEEQQREAKHREEQLMNDLEARVKRALQAKDAQIAELRSRCAASENKAREFEYLLARQREELLNGLTREVLS